MLSEENFECVKLLGNALDVVQPVHPDDDLALLEALLELVETLLNNGELYTLDKLPGVNSDGERADLDPAALKLDAVGLCFKTQDASARA